MPPTIWAMHAVNMLDDPKVRALKRLGGWGAVELWREIIGYNREFHADGRIPPHDFDAAFLGRRMLSQDTSLKDLRAWLKHIVTVGLVRLEEEGEDQLISAWPRWRPDRVMAGDRQRRKREREAETSRGGRDSPGGSALRTKRDAERDKTVTPSVTETAAKRDGKRDGNVTRERERSEMYRTSPVPGPLTPDWAAPTPGDVRSKPDQPPEERDPIAELLLSIGMFDRHPKPEIPCAAAARKARVWGTGFEDLGELWEHLERTADNPRAVLGWALQDAGKLKCARSKVRPRVASPAPPRPPPGPSKPNLADGFGPRPAHRDRPPGSDRQATALEAFAMRFAFPPSSSRSPFRDAP